MKLFTCKIIVLTLAVSLQANWQEATDTLTASSGSSGDNFGYSVSTGDKYAVVGAPDATAGGAIYIFKKESDGTWIQWQKLQNPAVSDTVSNISGFGASVAISETKDPRTTGPVLPQDINLLVVGAPDSYIDLNEAAITYYTGAICTYELNSTSSLWQQQGVCTFGDPITDDVHQFGYSVDISSSIGYREDHLYYSAHLVVGDPDVDGKYTDEGAVTFFDYMFLTHTWDSVATVKNPSSYGDNNINFGYSVAVDDSYVIIGAPGTVLVDTTPIYQVGTAYFYSTSGAYISKFTPLHTEEVGGHHFGTSVDISLDMSNHYAIIGEAHRLGGTSFGAAYILKKPATEWVENRVLEGSEHGYGTSVTINSNHAAVGAPTRNYLNKLTGTYVYTGAVYVYENDGSDNWSESLYDTGTENSFFGQSISLHDDSLLVGAHGAEYVQPYESKKWFIPAIIMYLLD